MKANRIKPLPTATLAIGVLAAVGGALVWSRWAAAQPDLAKRTQARLAEGTS